MQNSMATLTTAARNAACNAIVDLIDVGGAGSLVFQTAASAEVATLTFSATAFGASSVGVATAASITSDTNATGSGSNITKAVIQDGAATEVMTVTVGVSASDINLTSVLVAATETVAVTSLTVTVPA